MYNRVNTEVITRKSLPYRQAIIRKRVWVFSMSGFSLNTMINKLLLTHSDSVQDRPFSKEISGFNAESL